ncbi:MAG TPA: hypothetical protein VGV37_10845 [Aliidongia sp.]|uniref:hypothetical protein n=1 Tax=Aliidongia sp. TaxID=1914230 RepID=UPI002DDCB72B|nr:hypothetical protein [Aliidongia sp.]HEV2675027.1 hypothetical protein [Aliidongia sp.]
MGRTALLVAAAILVVGGALVLMLRPTAHYPIARIALPDDIALSFLQAPVKSDADCQTANQRVTATMLASCHECSLAESRCAGEAPAALGATTAGTQDMIMAKGLRILVTAPPAAAHALCQTLAGGIARNDASARCVPAAN